MADKEVTGSADSVKNSATTSPKKRKNQSQCWEHFTKSKDGTKAYCKYCPINYSYDGKNGTTTIRNHMFSCERSPFVQESKKQKTLAFVSKNQLGEGQGGSGTTTELRAISWTKEGFRKALVKYIILDELPFRHVEGEGFKHYSLYLNSKFEAPSRITVGKDIYRLFQDEKHKLKKVLMNQRLSITTDTWTSIQNINYMCVTAHWIDDEWKLQKRIIGFFQISDHKGDTIAIELSNCFTDWGITKILTITVDNASANDVAVGRKLLKKLKEKKGFLVLDGELLHMRCVCHITNLIVGAGLKDIAPSILHIRHSVRYVRSSPARLKSFKDCVVQEQIQSKALLTMDVATRWNSTFLMLESALKYQRAFDRLEGDLYYRHYFEESVNGKNIEGPPTEIDWDNAVVFVKFLKIFYDLTLRLSGTSYATSNLLLKEVCAVKKVLNGLLVSSDNLLIQMTTNMNSKFHKYWGDADKINPVLFLGTILDPRYKFIVVRHCIKFLFGDDAAQVCMSKVQETLNKLFIEYSDAELNPQPSSSTIWPQSSQDSLQGTQPGEIETEIHSSSEDFLMDIMDELEIDGCEKNEIERYMSEANENMLAKDFDILAWWKLNSNKYKILGKIAKDILAIPMSTVASESAFSMSGRILDPYRSSLAPKMVEALLCLKNWLSGGDAMIVCKLYMDEVESLKDSIEVVGDVESTVLKDHVNGTSLFMTVARSIGDNPAQLGGLCLTQVGAKGTAIHLLTFYAPLWMVVFFNGFTYIQVTRMLNNATRMAADMSDRIFQIEMKADIKALNRWGYYPLILIGSWAFGTINRFHDFIFPRHKLLWLSVLDVGTASLMGFFNSIAYGLNASMRRSICERLELICPQRFQQWLPNNWKRRDGQQHNNELVSLKIADPT